MTIMDERRLPVDGIAEYLGVSKDTVYAWIIKKDMPDHRMGRLWKFKRKEIVGWVTSVGASDKQGLGTKRTKE